MRHVSMRMEPQAFKEGLVEVEQLGIEVKEVVTDAHSPIAIRFIGKIFFVLLFCIVHISLLNLNLDRLWM